MNAVKLAKECEASGPDEIPSEIIELIKRIKLEY